MAPQIMEVHPWQPGLLHKTVKPSPNGVRPVLFSLVRAKDQVMVLPYRSRVQSFRKLPRSVDGEDLKDRLGKKERSFTCFCFRISHRKTMIFRLRQAAMNVDHPRLKIEITPTQCEQLPDPRSHCQGKRDEWLHHRSLCHL